MLAELTRTPSFLMADIARRMRYRFDHRTRALGITRPQWRMLLLLARHDGPSQSDLADMLDVERITLCRMVDRVAEAGLVERRADPSDRRVWRIHLTAKAMPLVEQLTVVVRELEDEMLAALSPQETTILAELLRRISEADEAKAEQKTMTGARA